MPPTRRVARHFLRPSRRRPLVAALALVCVGAPVTASAGHADTVSPLAKLPPQHLAEAPAALHGTPDDTRVVSPGESLWSIAATTLTSHLGTAPMPGEIDPFWREIVRLNLPNLRSGNADLIHPGEVVMMPDRP